MVKRTFLVYLLLELAVLAALTWAVGLGWTLLVLLATSVVGVGLAGSQVSRQIARLRAIPTNPQAAVADSMLVALGTTLVFVPGLVSTLVGALMLLPPTRLVMRPVAAAMLNRAVRTEIPLVTPAGGYPGRGNYIDGEVIDEQVFGRVHDARVVPSGSLVRYYGASDITR
jgi:UPF0716 protein FxsA